MNTVQELGNARIIIDKAYHDIFAEALLISKNMNYDDKEKVYENARKLAHEADIIYFNIKRSIK
jgi:hypothetical protein